MCEFRNLRLTPRHGEYVGSTALIVVYCRPSIAFAGALWLSLPMCMFWQKLLIRKCTRFPTVTVSTGSTLYLSSLWMARSMVCITPAQVHMLCHKGQCQSTCCENRRHWKSMQFSPTLALSTCLQLDRRCASTCRRYDWFRRSNSGEMYFICWPPFFTAQKRRRWPAAAAASM